MQFTIEQLKEILNNHQKWLTGRGGKRADLSNANLSGANLRGVDLSCANLSDANLLGANLRGANNIPSYLPQLIVCPPCGSFTAFKKGANQTIIELFVPKNAKRSNATTRKCRCDRARVVAIWDAQGKSINTTWSMRDDKFGYSVGRYVKVNNFDDNRWNECSTGIHFFMSKEEAENYI